MLHEIFLTQIGTLPQRNICTVQLPVADCYRKFVQIWDKCRERWTQVRSRGIDFIQEMLTRSSVSERWHYQDHREHVHLQHYCMIFLSLQLALMYLLFHRQKVIRRHNSEVQEKHALRCRFDKAWGMTIQLTLIKKSVIWCGYHFYCSHSATNLYSF